MTKCWWLIPLLASTVAGRAQAGPQAQTRGICSPAISGSSNAKITITCSTISPQKADQLVKLMNRILKEQIDPEKVYQQLDEIKASMGKIDAAVNPLAHVAPEVAERVKRGQGLQEQCFSLLQDWGHDSQQAYSAAREASMASMKSGHQPPRATPKEITAPIDREYAAKYVSQLQPALEEWRGKVTATSSDLRVLFPDPLIPSTLSDLSNVCFKVAGLNRQYYQDVTGSPAPGPFQAK
jgi:hypothetical protein